MATVSNQISLKKAFFYVQKCIAVAKFAFIFRYTVLSQRLLAFLTFEHQRILESENPSLKIDSLPLTLYWAHF